MVGAGLIVEFLFHGLGIERTVRDVKIIDASVTWNYTTILNIIFLPLAAVLVWRYFKRGGGPKMLRMMNEPRDHSHHHDPDHEHDHHHDHGAPGFSVGLSIACPFGATSRSRVSSRKRRKRRRAGETCSCETARLTPRAGGTDRWCSRACR
jgi:ABC-type nickel/cobalt efflux system permease component RcnA